MTNGRADGAVTARQLLDAANAASGQARNAWLVFLGLIAYLTVAITGITHKDMLLDSPIGLPIVDVRIPVIGFALFAPLLLLLLHFGLLIQHAVLGQKYDRFNLKIARYETPGMRSHPDRGLVHSFVFSQILAGPRSPILFELLMRLMVFATITALPVLTLTYFQIKFLPLHDSLVTNLHRVTILLDMIILIVVRPLTPLPYLRPNSRKFGFGPRHWPWEISSWGIGVAAVAVPAMVGFHLFVVTIPGEMTDQPIWAPSEDVRKRECKFLAADEDKAVKAIVDLEPRPEPTNSEAVPKEKHRSKLFDCFPWLFESGPAGERHKLTGLFARNIVVTDTDLVPDKDDQFEEVSLTLRDRDLRFAVLDRSDLHLADLTNSNLSGASATEIRLENADLERAELQGADLRFAGLQGANLGYASLQGANLFSASLQGATLIQARLQGANLIGIDLEGANLFSASLQGADLQNARLQGANLASAGLWGADLSYAGLQGANLFSASLQGADLENARLQGAKLDFAKLQGANLDFARLQGVNLSEARLQGATLIQARLQGATLSQARFQGADLWDAKIWRTRPPRYQDPPLANFSATSIAPLQESEREDLRSLIAESKDTEWNDRLRRRLEPLLSDDVGAAWFGRNEFQAWTYLKRVSRPRPEAAELSVFLADLACADDTIGHIAGGVARRGLSNMFVYNGDLKVLAQAMTKKSCKGSQALPDATKNQLCTQADWPEGHIGDTFCAP